VNSDARGRVLDNAVVRYCLANWGEILGPEPGQVKENGPAWEVPTNLLAINQLHSLTGMLSVMALITTVVRLRSPALGMKLRSFAHTCRHAKA
jgi:hypothetical protein